MEEIRWTSRICLKNDVLDQGRLMRRFGYFWTGLPLASKLQFVAMGLILGSVFVERDLKLRWFGLPLWQITIPLILGTFLLGRMLLPLMLWRPIPAQRFLYWLGITVFLVGLLSMTQRWGRMMIVHVGLTTAMWLDASCWFWFVSEIQKRTQAMQSPPDDESAAFDRSEDTAE